MIEGNRACIRGRRLRSMQAFLLEGSSHDATDKFENSVEAILDSLFLLIPLLKNTIMTMNN